MKKIILLGVVSLFLVLAFGCQKAETPTNNDSIVFTGTVKTVEDTRIFVAGDSQFDEVFVNVASTTKIQLKDGQAGSIKDLKEGQKVSIEYTGIVASSMPPQITATLITIK